jgi:CDP-glycerol glycerophosphotransferase (TagB/SpsB family)
MNIAYMPFKLLKTTKKVVMISRQSNEINDDFLLLGEEFKQKGYNVKYLCHTLDGGVNSSVFTKINYGFHMFTQMYHLATSEICVLDTYCLVVSILKHKKNLRIVQIWHSIGTLKQFGWENLFDVVIGRESSNFTKESGEPTKLAIKKLNANPKRTIMIGDTPTDHISAKNAGIINA